MPAEAHALTRALLVGAPRPLLSHRAEAALGARHRSILDNLEELLRKGELGELTIGELATRLGCSRRTLYELAPSKDQLFLLVLDRLLHSMGRSALGALDPGAPAAVQLRQYAKPHASANAFRSDAFDDLAELPGARRLIERHYQFAATIIERIVAAGIDNGEFRSVDPSVAAQVILASAIQLALPDVIDHLGLSLDDASGEMIDLVLTGLLDRRSAGLSPSPVAGPTASRMRKRSAAVGT